MSVTIYNAVGVLEGIVCVLRCIDQIIHHAYICRYIGMSIIIWRSASAPYFSLNGAHGRPFKFGGVALLVELRTTHYAIRTTHYEIRNAHYEIQTTHYELRTTRYGLQSLHYEPRPTDYELRRLH